MNISPVPFKILFPTEQFDLANEYDPETSTFIPKSQGVYSIIASIIFTPNNPNENYYVALVIVVNGVNSVTSDDEFFAGSLILQNAVISVSAILQLQAGDKVEVYANASTTGVVTSIFPTDRNATNFQAARFPS